MEGEGTSHMRRNDLAGKGCPSATPRTLIEESPTAPRRHGSASLMYVRTMNPELRSDFSQALVCVFIF